jgi:hypothetical protein
MDEDEMDELDVTSIRFLQNLYALLQIVMNPKD